MTAMLWARFVLLAALGLVVVLCARAAGAGDD
jgi:hypothetical protein